MLEVTNEKLKEAAFFVAQLTRASDGMIGEEVAAFPYYLSAFLSAARSVTFVLQAEEKEKYDKWFPHWLKGQTQEDRDLLEFMKGQRNQVLKQGRSDIVYSLQLVPIVKASAAERRQSLAFQWFGPPGTPTPAIPRRVRHFDLNGTPSEVLQACVQYLRLLETLVSEFLKAYTLPNRVAGGV